MADLRPVENSEEDLDRKAEVRPEDIDHARTWNKTHMPPPMDNLAEAEATDRIPDKLRLI